jgi:segregation and condensation protein A
LSYLVHLQQFEGPLGLLLYLIRKEEMDILDINVGEITRQYLEYIRMMKELDLEVAGEFVAMAATLIHIKSRMLLPQYNEEGEVLEAEDPRKELVQKLLDYQKYQEAAKLLYERPLLGRDVFARGIREDLRSDDDGLIILEDEGLFGLIAAYRRVVRKAQRAVHKVRPKVQSIASRVLELKDRLIVGTRVVLADLITAGGPQRRTQLLVTFLSMLELGRMGFVSVFQSEVYGDIHIEPKKAIERNVLERVQEFDAGDAEAVANSIINDAIEEKIDMAEAMSGEQVDNALMGDAMQMGLGEVSLDAILESPMGPEQIIETSDMASDDEILAAELEIEKHEAEQAHFDAIRAANSELEPGIEAGTETVIGAEGDAGADDATV